MLTFLVRAPRTAFFFSGAAITGLCFFLQVTWLEIVQAWLGLAVSYDQRPGWLVATMALVAWLPFVLLAALIVLLLLRGPVYRPIAFALGGAALYVVVVGLLFVDPAVDSYQHQRPFDSQQWKARRAEDPLWPDRLQMVDDLLARIPLTGLPKARVIELLGPGDQTNYFKDWQLVYWLGPERGLIRIDSEWLVIRIGDDERVLDYRLVRD